MINKEQWYEFRNHSGFEAQSEEIRRILGQCTSEIVTRQTSDELRDFFLRGVIWALGEIHDYEPDFPEEGGVNEEAS